MIRKIPDDSDRNYDIVHMIKKIAIALETKNVDDIRAIANQLEAWQPHGDWDKLDVRTKVFVEHILLGLGRIQLGIELLDKGADELTVIRQKMEKDEIHDVMDEADKSEECDGRYDELVREYDELTRKYDEIQKENFYLAQKITTENLDEFSRRNLSRIGEEGKFTCEKCGIVKRRSAPGANNCKEVDGHEICAICYRAFKNWFDKTNRKLDEFWDRKDVRKGTYLNGFTDGGPIDKEKIQDFVKRLMRDHSLPDGQIDWKKFHRAKRKWHESKEKERRNKERYKKNELSDQDKDELK